MTNNELIFIISLILGIIIAVLFAYRKELSTTSYSGAVVLQKEEVDVCGNVYKDKYYIEYDRYFLGFIKMRTKFTKESCHYGDCFDIVMYDDDISFLIKKFNEKAGSVIKQRKIEKIQDIPNKNC